MNKKIWLGAILTMLSAGANAAGTWQSEVSIGYTAFERDGVLKDNYWGVSGRYLFAPLPVEGAYPYAEAQFVERMGSIGAAYTRGESEVIGGRSHDTSSYGVGITAMRSDSPYYWSLGVGKAQTKDANFSVLPARTEQLAIGAGFFVSQAFLVGAEYLRIKSRYTFGGVLTDNNFEDIETSVFTRYLGDAGGAQFLGLSAGFSRRADDLQDTVNSEVFLSGRYYLNKAHGIGAGYKLNFGENKGRVGVTYSVGYEGFLTPSFSVYLSYQQFLIKDDASGSDFTNWGAGVVARF